MRIPERVVKRGLRRIPEGLTFPAAALLDPLASVLRGISRIPFDPATKILIYGAGPIALLFTVAAKQAGVGRILVAGRRAARLERLEACGAEPIDIATVSVGAVVKSATHGRGVDVVIETTGDPGIAVDCFDLVTRGGTVLLFAGLPGGTGLSVDAARIHYDEVNLIGSFHYTPSDAERALAFLASGAVPIDQIITGTRPLEDFAEVFNELRRGEGMKTAFVP